ncbi:MAG: ATP-binding cassette domain-containing protein [Candidatus Omnitrophica bacterium]|nr:ATP-binding cassette domain-containing protein [Candidatus Omnitrophota bacterium]
MKALKIQLINVSIGYMSETIIEDLSLDIMEGEFTGIFGPNGAGKTTLLCAVNGLARIPAGKVFINGEAFNILNENALRRKIGYVPQHFEIDAKLPVISEEVILMGRYGKMGCLRFVGNVEKNLMRELASLLEINHLLRKPFGQLSGGEKKRVLIARALMQEPEIMLLDEIFAWLDRDMASSFTKAIRDVHKTKNLTTLIVSHNIETIYKLCSRVIWMEEGKIVFDGSREDFMKRIRIYDGLN